MITLPFPPRKAELWTFWAVLTVLALLAVLLVTLSMIPQTLGLIVMTFVVILSVLALRVGRVPLLVYRVWNKTARILSEKGRQWILRVAFYSVLTPAGAKDSGLDLRRSESAESLWYRTAAALRSPAGADGGKAKRAQGTRTSQTNRPSSRLLFYALKPYLSLLSALRTENEETEPQNIYTLF